MMQTDLMSDSRNLAVVRRFSHITGLLALASFAVMVLGSLVRATDSGLACPDWPLCYDQAIPLFNLQIFLEWFHRVLAGSLSISFICLVYWAVRNESLRKIFGIQVVFAAAVLVVQVVLGGLTVLKLLDPTIVSIHLINAVLFSSVLIWMHLKADFVSSIQSLVFAPAKSIKYFYGFLTVLIFAQVMVGGMVSTNRAGLVCPDFPTCYGSWWPTHSFLVGLQMSHRYLGYLVALFIVMLPFVAMGWVRSAWTRRATRILPLLVLFQILLGVVNLYWAIPVWASVAHLANALLILFMSFAAFSELYFLSKNSDKVQELKHKAAVNESSHPSMMTPYEES